MTKNEVIERMKAARAARSPEEVKQHAENVAKAEAACQPAMDVIFAMGEKVRANPNASAWAALCETLAAAKQDKRIASHAGASGFLDVVYELAADALTFDNAGAAFKPVTAPLMKKNAELLKKLDKAKKP